MQEVESWKSQKWKSEAGKSRLHSVLYFSARNELLVKEDCVEGLEVNKVSTSKIIWGRTVKNKKHYWTYSPDNWGGQVELHFPAQSQQVKSQAGEEG